MKPNLLFALLGAALIAGLAGCKSNAYDPSLAPLTIAGDKVAVVGLKTVPTKPVAHQEWKVVMAIKNVGKDALTDITYQFVYEGNKKIGAGMIPHLNPGQVIEVASDPATRLKEGFYNIEGRVFLPKKNGEAEYSERVDNWRNLGVIVAQ